MAGFFLFFFCFDHAAICDTPHQNGYLPLANTPFYDFSAQMPARRTMTSADLSISWTLTHSYRE